MNRLVGALSVTFFGACLAFFGWRVVTNDRGLLLNGVLELGVGGADVCYGLLALASAGFVAMGLIGLLSPARTLVLDEDTLTVPSGLLHRTPRTARYADLRGATERGLSGNRLLVVKSLEGELVIKQVMLADRGTYEEVKAEIGARLEAR